MSIDLLVLVPLLLLPVVALLAFAGCEPFDAAPPATGVIVGPPLIVEPPVVIPPRPTYAETIGSARGLVAHWPLDDPEGALVARDTGPSRLNGRYVDGPPDVQRSKPGGAVSPREPRDRCAGFPGEDAHVVVDHSPMLNPGGLAPRFSFEVWVRLRDPGARIGSSEHLASSRLFETSAPNAGWDLYVTYGPGGVPTFTARVFNGVDATDTRADALVQSTVTPPRDAWHHVVMTYDGSGSGTVGVVVRLAGEPDPFPKVTSPAVYVPNASVALRFGAGFFGAPYNELEGDLDEAAFYNVVLSAAEIEAHHKAAQR